MGWTVEEYQPQIELEGPAVEPEVTDAVAFALRTGFRADEMQEQVLRSGAHRGILNCCRQAGKSSVTAQMALYRAHQEPGAVVLVASPSRRQSAEFLRKTCDYARELGLPTRGDGDNECSLLLPNGSRIVGLPGVERTVRGFSAVSMLIVDEAAQVPDGLYKALRPMLAVSDGDLWLLSTPYGKKGFFYENWTHGGEAWTRFQWTAEQCPRIGASFLEEERRQLGDAWFRQEYFCEFVDNGSALFARDVVEKSLTDDEWFRI